MLSGPQKIRVKFSKTGSLKFISHLDLNRTVKSAFLRSKLPIWYTKGFNPHAKLVFGLPLSVGTESMCEMADLKIERKISLEDIKNQLNEQLTDEMYVIDAYYPTTKFADIAYAEYDIILKSDAITKETADDANLLFSAPIIMSKRSKSGEKEVDITSFVKKIAFEAFEGQLKVNAVLCAGSTENLNPEYVVTALKSLCAMDDLNYTIMRNKVYDKHLIEFK